MNFIEKIFEKKEDNLVHLQFQKFSKGIFTNRALINAKKTGSKYTISTGPEFANELVRMVAEKLGEKKTKVTGGIISTVNLKEIPEYSDILANAKVKQFQGVKNFSIDSEMIGWEITKMVGAFPKAFFALSFSSEDSTLKIKPKAPKSGKPSNKEEIPKVDFCKLITTDEKLGEGFIFEKKEFKTAEVKHTFVIESIEVPQGLKDSKDFALIREESKRKGKIIRESAIDGERFRKEVGFEA